MSSNPNPNPNRNKVLLGFSAVVAVLIVAILLWPANVRKEDASGAIGAVQKHRAPQIAQQDVVLGGESVKHQQEVLYKDFLADAGKLRSIAASRDIAAAREFQAALQMRAMRASREAVDVASRLNDAEIQANLAQLNSMIRNKSVLSNDEQQAFNKELGIIAVLIGDRDAAFARMDRAGEELAHINLADEALAQKQLADVESTFNRVNADFDLADEIQYASAMEMESRVLSNENLAQRSQDLETLASKLESRAKANVTEAAAREQEMAMRCQRLAAEIQAAESRGTVNAKMVGSTELNARLGMLAQRLNQREAAAREIAAVRSLDAKSSQ
jgi:hypothetical protein